MNKRIKQLDSIRGLAALAVLFSHIPYFALGLPDEAYRLLVWFGLNDGHSFVMLFFLLSGFVLSIPFFKKDSINYLPYVIKRVFRIYIPYLFVIIVAITLSQFFLNKEALVVGDWNLLWNDSIHSQSITDHLLFLGNYDTNAFNGVIWSLIHELRISLIFPFLVLFIRRLNWKIVILICIVLSCISELNTVYHFQESVGYHTDFFKTVQYSTFFMYGALIAKHKSELVTKYQKINPFLKWILLIISLFLLKFSSFILLFLYRVTGLEGLSTHFNALSEYGVLLGCIGIVISGVSSIKLTNILLFKPFLFLGKISYSLYLIHLPIILSCIYLFNQVIPLWLISILAIFLSILISQFTWMLIENPSQKAGRDLAKMVNNQSLILLLRKVYKF